jgi:hypothetical protein
MLYPTLLTTAVLFATAQALALPSIDATAPSVNGTEPSFSGITTFVHIATSAC